MFLLAVQESPARSMAQRFDVDTTDLRNKHALMSKCVFALVACTDILMRKLTEATDCVDWNLFAPREDCAREAA